MTSAFDRWRGVPFGPDRPAGRILTDGELFLAREAFAAGHAAALERVRMLADGMHFAGALECERLVRLWLKRVAEP